MEKEELNKRIDEVLMPELKEDVKVIIGGEDIILRELPIFYTKQINRKMGPLYNVLSGNKKIEAQDLINLDRIENFYNLLIDISLIIIRYHTNNKEKFTEKFLEKHATERLLIEVIHKQLQVNGMLDFLERVLKGIVSILGNFGTLNDQKAKNTPNM